MEAQSEGATLITIDPRLSNTSAKSNIWLPAYSGTEGALLLAMVGVGVALGVGVWAAVRAGW